MSGLGLQPPIGDAELCDMLLAKASLTAMQAAQVVNAAMAIKAGGHLAKKKRDHFMALAAAQGLTKREKERPKKRGPNLSLDDPYTERQTAGTAYAEGILSRGRTADGRMLAPPTRKVG